MLRQSRKLEHIKYSMLLEDGPAAAGFTDFHLIHNCLPNLAWHDINIKTSVADIPLSQPIIINAITGGAEDVTSINRELAEFSSLTGAAMAVGSQYAAIEDPAVAASYKIVREVNPNGILFANLGAHVAPDSARYAVEMIGAQAIQIHLNAGQEIIMSEGDRDFNGYLAQIEMIASHVDVPVIVKEVGCGIAHEQAEALSNIGIKAIDVGGTGGTNFLAIEAARSNRELDKDMLEWGIPTAISALETITSTASPIDVIVSGGIRTPLDVVKALTIGGKAVGIAGPILKILRHKGIDGAVSWYNDFITDIKRYMLLVGASTLQELHSSPIVITGFSREWLNIRGVDTTVFANRKKHTKSMVK